MPLDSEHLRSHFLGAWGADTCYPHMSAEWSPENPARDQCGMTALVVHDIAGGTLVHAEVHVGGRQIGHHYWNRLPDGSDLDLTSDQFLSEEMRVGGEVLVRPPGATGRHREQYELLRSRVLAAIAACPDC